MAVVIAGSAVRTCLGDGAATFAGLLAGRCGAGPLRHFRPQQVNVGHAYQIAQDGADGEPWLLASRLLATCVREALDQAGVDAARERVSAVVGTGLRELRAVERWSDGPADLAAERLHFGAAVREAAPHVREVMTLSNACSAGGHALAVAQDLVELGEADAVVAAGADGMTASMLAMIGRFATSRTERVQPFDRNRAGVLLGEGAAAQVVVREGRVRRPLARVLASGLSCDAFHDTVPHADGVWRAIEDAFARAGRSPADVDVVIAHATGTALNDPLESAVLKRMYGANPPGPWVTGVKGAVGHTSGAAALVNVDVAIRCMATGLVPPLAGLKEPLAEGDGLRFVIGRPVGVPVRLAHSNALGFGGVNAVTLLEVAH